MVRSRTTVWLWTLGACLSLCACDGSSERRLFESCEATPECAVGLDCVVLRAEQSGTTAGAGFCTSRCALNFPCSAALLCTPVDRDGVVVGPGDPAARNAFCLRPCEDDHDCAAGMSCEATSSGPLCI